VEQLRCRFCGVEHGLQEVRPVFPGTHHYAAYKHGAFGQRAAARALRDLLQETSEVRYTLCGVCAAHVPLRVALRGRSTPEEIRGFLRLVLTKYLNRGDKAAVRQMFNRLIEAS
jgi:hypothetical protein